MIWKVLGQSRPFDGQCEKIAKLKNNHVEKSEKAIVASSIIRNNFSWQKSIEKAFNTLKERKLLGLKYSIQG